jgi:hypothetical protein
LSVFSRLNVLDGKWVENSIYGKYMSKTFIFKNLFTVSLKYTKGEKVEQLPN